MFLACRNLAGALHSIRAVQALRGRGEELLETSVNHVLDTSVKQLDEALCAFRDETQRLRSRGDKLKLAEAVQAFFAPTKARDERIYRICRMAIEMRGDNPYPSQAELRHALAKEGTTFSDEDWKRQIRRLGLNKKLPTHRQKLGGILRNA